MAAVKSSLEKSNPYNLGNDLFGIYGSGKDDLSKTYKEKVKKKIKKRYLANME